MRGGAAATGRWDLVKFYERIDHCLLASLAIELADWRVLRLLRVSLLAYSAPRFLRIGL